MSILKFFARKRDEDRVYGLKCLGWFMCATAVATVFFSAFTAFKSFSPKTMASVTDTSIETKVETKLVSKPGRHAGTSDDDKVKKTFTDYQLKVGYKYSVNNQDYEGRGLAFSDDDEQVVISKQKDEYPVGRKIQISYDSANPTDSNLRPATLGMSLVFLLTALALALGGFKLTKSKMPVDVSKENY